MKYVGKQNADHLVSVLQEHYAINIDWDGTRYIGLTLDWDYSHHKVHLFMPGYIENALLRFAHEPLSKPQHQPHPSADKKYGETVQYAKALDNSPLLPPDGKTYIQQVLGVLMYYGRAVDATLLVALSSIASAQAAPTELTLSLIKQLLNYVSTHPDAIITYERSDMVVAVDSDAHFYMSSDTDDPPNNGAILNISKIMTSVNSSAADAELGALYINACEAVAIRNLLHEMGH